MTTLYRKYRPKSWDTLVAQQHVKATLMQELISGNIGHAFLFTGPRGVGKTTTARLLAKALQCKNRGNSPDACGQCESCKAIHEGRHIDVIEIDAASHTGVDNVRENIIETARVRPTLSPYKIFIIDEVHMLSGSAFNALLKTIEEPPEHVTFILATTELHKVPATIISRCQCFDFRHLSNGVIIERLGILAKDEGKTVDLQVLAHIAWRAGGSMRDAESILGQILALPDAHITAERAAEILPTRQSSDVFAYLDACLSHRAAHACEIIAALVARGVSIPHLMDECIDCARALLLVKTTGNVGNQFFTEEDMKQLTHIAHTYDMTRLFQMLEILVARRGAIGSSPILHLPLELAAIQMTLSNASELPPAPHGEGSAAKNTPEKSSTKKDITHSPPLGSIPSIETIRQRWPEFLEHIHLYNHSLPFILKTCAPQRVEDSTLIVSVPYAFHKKRMEEKKVAVLITQALSDVLGCAMSLQGEVDESRIPEGDAVVAKVLETFGGEVVS